MHPNFLKFRHLDGIHDYPITHPTLKPELNRGSVFFWRSDYLPAYFWQHRTKILQEDLPYQVNSLLTHHFTKVWAYTKMYIAIIFLPSHTEMPCYFQGLFSDLSGPTDPCPISCTCIPWCGLPNNSCIYITQDPELISWRRFLQSTTIALHPM